MTDEVSGQLAEYFGVKQGQGVLVKEVIEGSAAAKAGVKAGDVIIRINDDTVNDVGDLRQALNRAESKEVTVTVVRDRREQTLKVTLDEPQRRRPRRTAGLDELLWIEQSEAQERALEAQLEALEQQAAESQEHQEQMRLLEDQMREMEEQLEQRLQSEQFEKQMQLLDKQRQQYDQQLKRQIESEAMRELERRLREAERWRDVI
jgi:membrane-associated protease RseP (regulator of RpoE activity)